MSSKKCKENSGETRRKAKRKDQPAILNGDPKTSPTIERWVEKFGKRPNFTGIGRVIGVSDEAVRRVMLDGEPWEPTQDAIAKLAGMSVGELFGDAAWFRQAGRELSRRRERRAS